MCYTKELSLTAFLFGITSSVLLIKYGNDYHSKTNQAVGIFFIYISFAQLLEYLIWIDLPCSSGTNKTATKYGSLLIHFQPVVLSFLLLYYLPDENLLISKNIMILLNVIYIGYVGYKYGQFIQKGNECTSTNEQNHLDWQWKYDFNYTYYQLIMFLNFINYFNNKYIRLLFIITYLLFAISWTGFNENIPEIWCLLSTSVPALILLFQKLEIKFAKNKGEIIDIIQY